MGNILQSAYNSGSKSNSTFQIYVEPQEDYNTKRVIYWENLDNVSTYKIYRNNKFYAEYDEYTFNITVSKHGYIEIDKTNEPLDIGERISLTDLYPSENIDSFTYFVVAYLNNKNIVTSNVETIYSYDI